MQGNGIFFKIQICSFFAVFVLISLRFHYLSAVVCISRVIWWAFASGVFIGCAMAVSRNIRLYFYHSAFLPRILVRTLAINIANFSGLYSNGKSINQSTHQPINDGNGTVTLRWMVLYQRNGNKQHCAYVTHAPWNRYFQMHFNSCLLFCWFCFSSVFFRSCLFIFVLVNNLMMHWKDHVCHTWGRKHTHTFHLPPAWALRSNFWHRICHHPLLAVSSFFQNFLSQPNCFSWMKLRGIMKFYTRI